MKDLVRTYLSILLVGVVSACAEPKAVARPDARRLGPGEHVLTLNSGGLERLYIVYVPPGYDGKRPVPLVIVFHGGGGRASGIRSVTSMDRVADTNGFVVVYPQGLNRVWNDGGSDLGQRPPRDDVGFVRDLVKDVSRKVSVNGRQVFACGFSNGGALTARLTLEAPDLIAAAAMVGSGLYVKQQHEHPKPKPMPVLFIEGTEDPCHPYKGGEAIGPRMNGLFKGEHHGAVLSADDVVSFWRKINGCEGLPKVIELPHKTRDSTSTTYRHWSGASGNDVAEYTVQGGGHCWPGGLQYFPVDVIGKTSYEFDASEAIWRFFEHRQRTQR